MSIDTAWISLRQRINALRIPLPLSLQGFRLRHASVWLWRKKVHEPDITNLIRRLVAPGMPVADVGAFIGYHSLLMTSCGAEVYAFEGSRRTYGELLENVALNGARSICPVHAAVAEGAGFETFYETDKPGQNSLFENPKARAEQVRVLTVSLDSLGVPFKFIKIDAEGAELKVLEGARALIRSGAWMTLEFSPNWFKSLKQDPREFLDALKGFGLRYYMLSEDGTVAERSDDEIMRRVPSGHANLFATAGEVPQALLPV